MQIPTFLFDLYNTTVSDMIDYNFGVPCTLYYGTNKELCPNCIFNEATGHSLNEYKVGGPVPFDSGVCPYCNGEGFVDNQATEDIKLRVYFARKDWVKIELPINIRDGAIQTIGHIADMPKCKRANKIQVCTDISAYNTYTFELAGEPTPHGFKKDHFFIAFWNLQK